MIIIAGGGIGGLTLGCAFSRAGKPFRIFERAPELRAVGAGIALSPNAFQALAHIGIADQVRACGWDVAIAELSDSKGRVFVRVRMPKLAAGVTQTMTRANLQKALLKKLGTTVETGRAVVGYQSISGGIRVRLADGEEWRLNCSWAPMDCAPPCVARCAAMNRCVTVVKRAGADSSVTLKSTNLMASWRAGVPASVSASFR